MFGMGGTEIIVILIVALLFLGPDKLPEVAKQVSKGIRDIKKQSRVLQRTIEDDEHIGGAIRDLKSALRGEDEPVRPKPLKPPKQLAEPVEPALPAPGTPEHGAGPDQPAAGAAEVATAVAMIAVAPAVATIEPNIHGDGGATATAADMATDGKPALTMPPTAGEADEGAPAASPASEDAELAAMVKPAANTIPHKSPAAAELPEASEPKHG